ncbi:MAG: CDP-diacylglycerol--glycerol-3-phosphate 3-phosphatidyltransferase [Spirochaetaceae bacterium]|nr:MAG: CDP-diacylglycerol--glycerol-3-phosphate 3-phosphatidyltransferase [Spirochaetaceae bacterium]
MNIATSLTASRLVLSPVFFVVFFVPIWFGVLAVPSAVILWILFLFMEFSDAADGYVARKRNEVTDLGKVMDPFADVISHLTCFVCLSAVGIMPVWIFLLLMYREFGIVFIRLLMIKEGVALAARKGGKIKTVFFAIGVGLGIAVITLERMAVLPEAEAVLRIVTLVVFGIALVLSLSSFGDYLRVFVAHMRGKDNQAQA